MTDSILDPAQFLDATTTGEFTRRPPLPPGEYVGTISEMKPSAGTKDGRDWKALNIAVEIDLAAYPEAKAALGGELEKVALFDFVGIDLTPNGMLDNAVGKNRGLKRYRDATGLNTPGEQFAPRMLTGRQVKVRVKHEPYQGEMQEKIAAMSAVS